MGNSYCCRPDRDIVYQDWSKNIKKINLEFKNIDFNENQQRDFYIEFLIYMQEVKASENEKCK